MHSNEDDYALAIFGTGFRGKRSALEALALALTPFALPASLPLKRPGGLQPQMGHHPKQELVNGVINRGWTVVEGRNGRKETAPPESASACFPDGSG